MRTARTLSGLMLLLALALKVQGQTTPYSARVVVPEAEVRSGPSAHMYATNRLHQGDPVEVVELRPDGWFGIKPPRGSFSWIEVRSVQPLPGNSWVVHTPAQPLIGSEVVQEKPTVRGPWLQPGFLLYGFNGPRSRLMDQAGVEWQAVQAPAGKEVRFIQGSDIMPVSGPIPTVAAAPARSPGSPPGTSSILQPPQIEPPSSQPLWIQARTAQQAGRVSEAVRAYEQLGQQLAATNYAQAILCYNEAAYLRNSHEGSAASSRAGLQRTSAPAPVQPALSLGAPTTVQTGTVPSYYASAFFASPLAQWSGPGRLRLSGRSIDGRITYVLETTYGQMLMYVTALPGVNLDPYLGRMVELNGPLVYRGDLRANYMTAQYAVPAP
jgi:hypothetical protein